MNQNKMSEETGLSQEKQKTGSSHEKIVRPGMSIVMSKRIGLQGTARLVREHEAEMSARLPVRMIREMATYGDGLTVAAEREIAARFDVCDLREIKAGGIWRALWELAQDYDAGLTVDLHRIPVKQETIEACEIFGLNPYELLSGGAALMVTWQGAALTAALLKAGIHAAVIGFITGSRDRIVVRHTAEGVKVRYLNRPAADEIEKI